jgi:nitrite reductase (cytochrome c-552)
LRTGALLALAFILGGVVMAGIGALLVNINTRQIEGAQSPAKLVEIPADELDASVWGQNFPLHYDAFMKTKDDTISTPYGGNVKYSKLERFPALVRIWAGYAFSVDHNEDRGHFYALEDQLQTERIKIVKQPGACANCHAGEAPVLIKEMGWEAFNKTPYDEIKDKLHTGSTCNDCHDPATMALRISRPGFINAMQVRGVDVTKATRQEMRSYVCAQCHVEYYFAGDNKVLTFPWKNGLNIDEIDQYYTDIGFKDWAHKETNAPMLKMQHPEYELYTTGLHAKSGVACADCHMPYTRVGATKISDHWLRSPLTNINNTCQTCHKQDEKALEERILTIQNRTAELLRSTEEALIAAIDAINAAKAAGVTDEELKDVLYLHRRSSMRWDFISSENSTGFHSPQEAARVLANAIDLARQAEIGAIKLMSAKQKQAAGNVPVALAESAQ